MDQIVIAVVVAVVTGGISALATVKALHVHINYLSKNDERQEQAIARAHKRIDSLEH